MYHLADHQSSFVVFDVVGLVGPVSCPQSPSHIIPEFNQGSFLQTFPDIQYIYFCVFVDATNSLGGFSEKWGKGRKEDETFLTELTWI